MATLTDYCLVYLPSNAPPSVLFLDAQERERFSRMSDVLARVRGTTEHRAACLAVGDRRVCGSNITESRASLSAQWSGVGAALCTHFCTVGCGSRLVSVVHVVLNIGAAFAEAGGDFGRQRVTVRGLQRQANVCTGPHLIAIACGVL